MSTSSPQPTRAALLRALEDVQDPELPLSVVDMGLIVDLEFLSPVVKLKLTYTAMGCPAMEMIQDDIRARLLREPGVGRVDIEVVWDPVWAPDRLSPRARRQMRALGVAT